MWTATSPTRIIKEQTAWWFQHLSTITLHPRKRDDTPNKFTFWCFLRLKSAGSCCWNPKNQFVSKSFGILWLKLSSEGQQDSGAYSWSWAYEPNNIGNTWEYEVTGDSEKISHSVSDPNFWGEIYSLFWAWSSQFQSWIVMAIVATAGAKHIATDCYHGAMVNHRQFYL